MKALKKTGLSASLKLKILSETRRKALLEGTTQSVCSQSLNF